MGRLIAVLGAFVACALGATECSIVGSPDIEVHVAIGVASGESPREQALILPETGELSFELPSGVSTVDLHAAGFWAAPFVLDESDEPCRLELLPIGRLSARLPADSTVGSARVRFEPATGSGEPNEQSCDIAAGQIVCRIPEGRHDVRLDVDDYVPIYLWHQAIEAGKTADLGALDLRVGASVSGAVVVSGRGGRAVELELKPVVFGWHGDPKERSRFDRRALQTSADERGFFQFVGVAPGRYVLHADGGDVGRSVVDRLVVEAGRELALPPIELVPPASAELGIDPPLDPWGQPWSLALRQIADRANVFVVVAKTRTREGLAAFDDLESGDYEVVVNDSEGSTWRVEHLEVFAGMASRFLEIDTVPIEGTLSIGDEPLVARVVFGGQTRPRLRFTTDEDGRFHGSLPREGTWLIDLEGIDSSWDRSIEPVEVKRRPGQSTAQVEIVVPNTRLHGLVTSSDEPVHLATVMVRRALDSDLVASLLSDEDGHFEIVGIEPGDIAIMALELRRDVVSPWTHLTIQDDSEHEIELRLQEKVRIDGRVFDAGGTPLAGAQILGLAVDGSNAPWHEQVVTAVDGSFGLGAPRTAPHVDLLLSAPGQPVVARRITTDSRQIDLRLPERGGELLLVPTDWSQPYTLAHGAAVLPLDQWRSLGELGGWFRLTDQGALRFRNLAIGQYRFCAVATGECVVGVVDGVEPIMLITPPLPDQPVGDSASPSSTDAGTLH